MVPGVFVNKLCTLVERSEVRDLVDVMLLERTGLRVEDALPRAQAKDGGVTRFGLPPVEVAEFHGGHGSCRAKRHARLRAWVQSA